MSKASSARIDRISAALRRLPERGRGRHLKRLAAVVDQEELQFHRARPGSARAPCSARRRAPAHDAGRRHRAGRSRGTSRSAEAPSAPRARASAGSRARSAAGRRRHRRCSKTSGLSSISSPQMSRFSTDNGKPGAVARPPCRQSGPECACRAPDRSGRPPPRGSCAPPGASSASSSSSSPDAGRGAIAATRYRTAFAQARLAGPFLF